jgi:Transposase DDE domain/Transposase domain (DUF772)
VATSTVSRHRDAKALASLLDTPELSRLVSDLEATRWTGRPGYPIRAMVGMALAKSLYAIPTWTRTVALVTEHAALRRAIGCRDIAGVPSVHACYRFTAKLRQHKGTLDACITNVLAALQDATPGFGTNVAIDGSDLPAYANGQRYVSKGGKERERFSDPDASWGHRSAISTRKGGGFYGYKVHAAVCTTTGLPVAWQVETARAAEAPLVPALLDSMIARGFDPQVCIADKGYDVGPVYDGCEARGVRPIIPLRQTPKVVAGEHRPPTCASTARGPSPVRTPSAVLPSTGARPPSAPRRARGSRLTGCTPSSPGSRRAGRRSTGAVQVSSGSLVA